MNEHNNRNIRDIITATHVDKKTSMLQTIHSQHFADTVHDNSIDDRTHQHKTQKQKHNSLTYRL